MKKDYSVIQDKFNERLDYMTRKHCKVTLVRMDCRFPESFPSEEVKGTFPKFIRKFKEGLARKSVDTEHVWCREMNKSDKPHYHLAVLADGSKVRAMGLQLDAERIWGNTVKKKNEGPEGGGSSNSGLVDFCNNHRGKKVSSEILIQRPSPKADPATQKLQQAEFEKKCEEARSRAAYLAKDETKGNVPPRIREHGCSRLKK